ncbi:transcription initiation factor IIE subunit beta [Auriscalpium vulgare]|uniref:Transcription initiation factor IIE subunit beta n=1 Tax=Auriscalpium vulgare TaxID=40419 RepID=A0ACB8RNE1_9AGAM|nr:transcription initiation factor IIE subunit beta [Auriscalpium vulgare]
MSLPGTSTPSWQTSGAVNPASSSAPLPAEADSGKKKKRPKPSIVYSQPADTGTGSNVNTQLLYVLNHLKSVNGPMRLQDIAIVTNTPLDTDTTLFEKFKGHERVEFDAKTNLYSFRNDYNFRNKAALLTEIQRSTRRGGGISMRALKESWKDSPNAIEELEKEGEVFVTRTLKDGQMRMVFWNEVKADPNELLEDGVGDDPSKRDASGNGTGLSVEKGAYPPRPLAPLSDLCVITEFHDLWHSLKVPNDVDLLKELQSEGLQATVSEAPAVKGPMGKKRGKKSAPRHRQTRITNTHLKGSIDLSKDYVAPGK